MGRVANCMPKTQCVSFRGLYDIGHICRPPTTQIANAEPPTEIAPLQCHDQPVRMGCVQPLNVPDLVPENSDSYLGLVPGMC